MTRGAGRWLALAVGGLVVAWTLTPMPGPPLYDGLILGNDPYRFVTVPSGHPSTPPPTTGYARVAVEAGVLQPFTVGTRERPPQAQVAGSVRAFAAPAGATNAEVRITPIQPDLPPPLGEVYDGNVYRISVTAGGRDLVELPGATVVAALRGTGMKGQPMFALRTSAGWSIFKPLATGTSGVYSLPIPSVGDVALVLPANAATVSSEHSFPTGPVVAVVVFALLLVALLLVVRLQRGETPSDPE